MERFYSINKESLISFFVVFIIFDLLFLPNFLASTPVSFFLLILLAPLLFSVVKESLLIYTLLIICIIASVINGLTMYTIGAEENLKRLIQISLVLSLIFLNFKKIKFCLVERLLNKVILLFIFYVFILFILSLVVPEIYLSIMALLSPNAFEMISGNVEMFRFSYMFSDPNTLGYLLVFISIYYLFHSKITLQSLLVMFLLSCLILSTQSRGALLAFVCFITMFSLSHFKFSLSTIKMSFLIILFFTLVFFIFQDFFIFIMEAFEKRSEIEDAMGTGMGGGRDKKYVYFINNLNFSFYGVGYSLFIDGIEFRPHSDLIRMVLSYGACSLFLFFLIFFPINFKTFLLLFSFLFPFLLNTAIDDYRLFGLFVILFMFMKYDRRLM